MLDPEGEQCMPIATFGVHGVRRRMCESMNVGMRLNNGQSRKIQLLPNPFHFERIMSISRD